MQIKSETVEKVRHLAKLEFEGEKREAMVEQLGEIVSYVKKLDELDTEGVTPTYHVLDLKNVMRKDQVAESLTQEEALLNAPRRKKGYFSVPKVIAEKAE